MGCDCDGSAFSCSPTERRTCVEAACSEGWSFTSLWATEEDAWECAKRMTRESGDLHFVESAWQFADDIPVGFSTFTVVNNNERRCEPGQMYDGRFSSNREFAEQCALMLNEWMAHHQRPARFQAALSGSRLFFSDVWQVDEI